jgi:hypothetical protein
VSLLFSLTPFVKVIYAKFEITNLDFGVVKSDWIDKCKDLYLMGLWAFASAIVFWLGTNGFYIFLFDFIPEDVAINSRLLLSLTGLIGFYLAAKENNLLTEVSGLVRTSNESKLTSLRKAYLKSFLIVYSVFVVGVVSFVTLLYSSLLNYFFMFFIFVIYQLIVGLVKFPVWILKSKSQFLYIFKCNLFSVLIGYFVFWLLYSQLDFAIALSMLSVVIIQCFLVINKRF